MNTQIENELEREMNQIWKMILRNPGEIIGNAIDIMLLKTLSGETMGFSIGITMGGPNIIWNYIRGKSELIGMWGSAEKRMSIPIDVAEEAMKYL